MPHLRRNGRRKAFSARGVHRRPRSASLVATTSSGRYVWRGSVPKWDGFVTGEHPDRAAGWADMTDDAELLGHYLRRGFEPWNVSLEAAWLDFELRAFVEPRIPARRPLELCNVGIGVGLWDDWLGHVVGAPITSIDRDPDVCRVFELRQRRERHPSPACVTCGDACDVLGIARFDVITIVGSTLEETTDRDRLEVAAFEALRPGGRLLLAEVGYVAAPPPADDVRRLGDVWLALAMRTR